ncbi:PREDICTED: DNA-binding [Prunus dulcis]|uniref:PREDICTED: DNA-binding n=1 Tax=Prunus dulcis TaxID=3755 RepID=A0A5E4G3J0_PRUDU|nr:PREDICTED: DNA-binding [Prunus dulcis]
MVQGLLLNALTTSRNGAFCGSMPSWRKHFKLMTKTQISSVIERHGIWHLCHQSLVLRGNPNMLKQRNVRVEAGWLFRRGDQGLNASSEQSEAANEDILIFFFQLDLATRVQYALNTEQYDIAQQLRNKLTEVEAEVIRQQEAKRGSSLKSEAQDKAISIIRLRADLQKAIESENYVLAAKLRDAISELEAESLAASAKALAHENANYSFRLGQRVRHKKFGYRAVVCGMDPVCCESSSWMETAQVEKLHRGSNQPFYQVLVDVHADPNLLVAYVSEENLLAPDEPDVQLREKYNRPRHEIPFDPLDEGHGSDA